MFKYDGCGCCIGSGHVRPYRPLRLDETEYPTFGTNRTCVWTFFDFDVYTGLFFLADQNVRIPSTYLQDKPFKLMYFDAFERSYAGHVEDSDILEVLFPGSLKLYGIVYDYKQDSVEMRNELFKTVELLRSRDDLEFKNISFVWNILLTRLVNYKGRTYVTLQFLYFVKNLYDIRSVKNDKYITFEKLEQTVGTYLRKPYHKTEKRKITVDIVIDTEDDLDVQKEMLFRQIDSFINSLNMQKRRVIQ
jgi:hypothetical protein